MKNKQPDPSNLTKVLITKIHGGRKEYKEYWQHANGPSVLEKGINRYSTSSNKHQSNLDSHKILFPVFVALLALIALIMMYFGYQQYLESKKSLKDTSYLMSQSKTANSKPVLASTTKPKPG